MSDFKFEDIQEGDYIKVTLLVNGVLEERRGKVGNLYLGVITSPEHGTIYHPGWVGTPLFELIDRPKPKLPGLPGALIIAKNMKYEEPEVVLINRSGAWETLDGYSVYQPQQIGEWALASLVEVKA